MVSKQVELEIKLAEYKARAEVWEKAFNIMAHHGVPVNDEVLKKVRSKKTVAENYQAGEEFAAKSLESLRMVEEQEMGVQNAFLASVGAWLREQVVECIVGYLVKLVKENIVKATDWLLGQTEDVVLKGYDRLSDEDKALLKNELKQYPRFGELLKKIEEK